MDFSDEQMEMVTFLQHFPEIPALFCYLLFTYSAVDSVLQLLKTEKLESTELLFSINSDFSLLL